MNITEAISADLFREHIFPYLYREEINVFYGACQWAKVMIDGEWREMYRRCLHHQPHNYDSEEPIIETRNGWEVEVWYKEGRVGREGDQPAVITADGGQEWWWKGERHREGDQPAVITADGGQEWWWKGKLHREGDQPAVIWASGSRELVTDGSGLGKARNTRLRQMRTLRNRYRKYKGISRR